MRRSLLIRAILLVWVPAVLFLVCGVAVGQDTQDPKVKVFEKDGVRFEYLPDWTLAETPGVDSQQIGLTNAQADSQILAIISTKRVDGKDPMPALKKQSVDPWVSQLVQMYARAGLHVYREPSSIEINGQAAEGAKLKFVLDGQTGVSEAYWTLMDKRLVLICFIRPDRQLAQATPGWDVFRKSLKIAPAKAKFEPVK